MEPAEATADNDDAMKADIRTSYHTGITGSDVLAG
jgi:hypothetical protein